jgi:hypothetical protein
MDKSTKKIIIRSRADVLNPIRLDNVVLMSDGFLREVSIISVIMQTPGYVYISESNMGEIDNIKFLLNPISTQNKPFIYSEGGSNNAPVTLKSSTFTTSSGSLVSLSYNVLEVAGGSIVVIGCTFASLKINPVISGENGVVVVKDSSIILRSTVLDDIQLEPNAAILGSGNSECEWGLHSVIILRNSISHLMDILMSNTYAGVVVHGGTADVEGSNFTSVGSRGNTKYSSVERHLRGGMELCCLYLIITVLFVDEKAVVNMSVANFDETSLWIDRDMDCILNDGTPSHFFIPKVNSVMLEYDSLLNGSFSLLYC